MSTSHLANNTVEKNHVGVRVGGFRLKVCIGLYVEAGGLYVEVEGPYKLQVQIPPASTWFFSAVSRARWLKI
jgi:hypothetical protein